MLSRRTGVFAVCFCVIGSPSFGDDSDWPQWRGPKRSGETSAGGVVTRWGHRQDVKWRLDLPEAGNSTPVVWGDSRLFDTTAFGIERTIADLC